MFLEAFGLRRDPFLDTADPGFYYDSLMAAHYRRRLVECLSSGRGLAVVVGAIGAGKTTLLNAVASDLLASDRHLVGLILDPTFSDEAELIAAIADCFGFEIETASLRRMKDSLKHALFEAALDKQPILLIDEAQTLPEQMLEPLRSILNFQLDDRKLLSIALSGQPELASAIARRPNMSDRVALWLELGPLRESESTGLIEHRLRHAGYAGARSPFEEDALHQVWLQSCGVPRRIVALARESMEVAAERLQPAVVPRHVEAAGARITPSSTSGVADDAKSGTLARRILRWFRRES
jgi:type II secretory pathway predicted ATPase ExeA